MEMVIAVLPTLLEHFLTHIHSPVYGERRADPKIENDAICKPHDWFLVM